MRRPLVLAVTLAAALLPLAVPGGVAAVGASNVRVVNLADHDFAVSWTTDAAASGSILFGPSCAAATTQAAENPSNGFVHLADAGGGLTAATTYFFKVVDGRTVDDNGGACYSVATLQQFASPPVPSTVFGYVKFDACATPAPGSLVILTVSRGAQTSLPLAASTTSTGGWSVVAGAATLPNGTLMNPQTGDQMTAEGEGTASDTVSIQTSFNASGGPQQLADLCLPAAPGPPAGATSTDTPLPTATGTNVPASTATSTPAPTATDTAIPTSSPTASSTTVPGATSTPTATPIIQPSATSNVGPPPPPPSTPTLTATATSTTPPPATATPIPTSTEAPPRVHIHIKVHLAHPSIRRGARQTITVHTDTGARVRMDVAYGDHSRPYHGSGRARNGAWQRHWKVHAGRPCTATVSLRVRLRGKTRYYTVRFGVV